VGADEWCSLCDDEFAEFKTTYRLPPSALTAAAAVVILSLLGSVASAWSAGNTGFSALLAPLLLCVVWAIVLPIASKLWIKLRFMRDLRPRIPPRTTTDTNGQEVMKAEGSEVALPAEGQGELPLMPSVIPTYDRTTLHNSLAPTIEPFAAGLSGMLPPAEGGGQKSDPPPSNRGPMVIRVDVPSFSPRDASLSLRPESTLQGSDGQLSAMARLAVFSGVPASERAETSDDERGHISSVMPTAAAVAPSILPAVGSATHMPTPASMVPAPGSDGPEIQVGVLSMPHLRGSAGTPALTTPAPILISSGVLPVPSEPTPPPPAQRIVTLRPAQGMAAPDPADDVAYTEERSGVRHALLRNEPGLLREACAPSAQIPLNRCS
jgi:hypothetical protein